MVACEGCRVTEMDGDGSVWFKSRSVSPRSIYGPSALRSVSTDVHRTKRHTAEFFTSVSSFRSFVELVNARNDVLFE